MVCLRAKEPEARSESFEQKIVLDISRLANAMNCIRHRAAARPLVSRRHDFARDCCFLLGALGLLEAANRIFVALQRRSRRLTENEDGIISVDLIQVKGSA
jgi:hypothetical protein